ncbi:glycosyl transferase [Bacteroidia bacterium]|nr:glycosyl transferase [Bacteroidia bacterium]
MISVIISIYKALDNLELILLALERQSFKDFEVIIAEDDDSPQTIAFLHEARARFPFSVLHVSQDDQGFRKCKILNKAIKISKGEKLVFLDGDCLPHRHLLQQYNNVITNGSFFAGRRVMLSKKLSTQIKQTKNAGSLSFFTCLIYACKSLKRAIYLPFLTERRNTGKRGLLGCNMGGTKHDIFAVNGFDEDYQLIAVGEDSDLDWRLRANGVQIKTVFYKCITYHLYHHTRWQDGVEEEAGKNRELMRRKQSAGLFFCRNGIKKQEN